MTICDGSYSEAVRINPVTKAGECSVCGEHFDYSELAGEKINVPGHSPAADSTQLAPGAAVTIRDIAGRVADRILGKRLKSSDQLLQSDTKGAE